MDNCGVSSVTVRAFSGAVTAPGHATIDQPTEDDLVFSRDQPERRYVQHCLLEEAERLRRWVDDGAAIYVCGSLEGMAGGVDAALQQVLGRDALDRLAQEGRYRRDVY